MSTQVAKFIVETPPEITADWIQRILSRQMWGIQRSRALAAAHKNLASMFPTEFGRLMDEQLSNTQPPEFSVKPYRAP